MTDESKLYIKVGEEFTQHQSVCHSAEEYVRGDVHTNTIEGYFSVFKRGMHGIALRRGPSASLPERVRFSL